MPCNKALLIDFCGVSGTGEILTFCLRMACEQEGSRAANVFTARYRRKLNENIRKIGVSFI